MKPVQDTNCLQRRIRLCAWVMILGLVLSGATAIPLQWQADKAVEVMGITNAPASSGQGASFTQWAWRVREGLRHVNAQYPFMAYGTDWLAFGHFAIAIAFIGVLRDPVRNIWLFEFGLIACALIIPYAMVFGAMRGIPWWWRCVDCSFGVFGAIPLWLGWRYTRQLAQAKTGANPWKP
jgi:hypothetical protein